MRSALRIQQYISSSFLVCLWATALIIPNHGQQHPIVLSTIEPSSLGAATNVALDDCRPKNPDVKDNTLIYKLWTQNCDLVEKFLTNNFTTYQATADEKDSLNSFKYYSVQDYYYLVETAQHKAFLMATWPPLGPNLILNISETVLSISGDLEYAVDFRKNITSQSHLGIDDNFIANGTLHAPGLGYVKWLQGRTNLGWFGFQISRLACIYGWAEIANKLKSSPTTKNNTIFYREWIEPNSDWSWGSELSDWLENNRLDYNISQTFPYYSRLFREGLRFEIAFFESAMNKTLNDIM